MKIYNTKDEERELNSIKCKYPTDTIINPKEFFSNKEKIENSSEIMNYCLDFIRKNVDILIFSQYKSFIGRGVYEEVTEAQKKSIPIYLLENDKFFANPKCVIHDPNDWAICYAKVIMETKT